MFNLPHDSDPPHCPPSSLERWARQEAKSDAMVDDVLAGSGATPHGAASNSTVRQLQLAVLTLLGVAALALAAAIIVFSVPPPGPASGAGPDHYATGAARGTDTIDSPTFWGPFRP